MKRSASPLQIAAILATWLLLSSSLSVLNVLIGLVLALLLPPLNQRKTNRSNLIAMLRMVPPTTVQGLKEGLSLPLQGLQSRPDVQDDPWPPWAGRDPMLRFSWLVMVSFTPKTLVLNTSRESVRTHLEKLP